MTLHAIRSDRLSPPVGPFSQAVSTGDLIFLSGRVGLDADGKLVPGGVVIRATTHFPEQARAMIRGVNMESLPPPMLGAFRNCATRGDAQVKDLLAQFANFANTTDDMNLTPADLTKVKPDTLIVHGGRDEFFPVAIPLAMYGAIPKAALWIVPGGDHSPNAGADQEEFLEVVEEFLAKP